MAYKYTLAEAVDLMFIQAQIDKKKFFANQLIIAGMVWPEISTHTLNVVKSVWLPVMEDTLGMYVEVPEDAENVHSLNDEDGCGNPVPLYFNRMFHVEQKPEKKECGCQGLCQEMEETTLTTKLMFSYAGQDYYEKKWVTVNPNGDVIEYREVPVKKYNDRTGDSGDHGPDYNSDFSIGNSFANLNIVTEKFSEKRCKLSLKDCGCVDNCKQNEELILETCGIYLNAGMHCCKKRCETFLGEINSKHYGEAALSDCESKIYLRKTRPGKDFYLMIYQTNGKSCISNNLVPEKALKALWAGINFRKKWLSSRFSPNEIEFARIAYEREKNDLITFNNKVKLSFLSNISSQKHLW